jgi:hypothetical protein
MFRNLGSGSQLQFLTIDSFKPAPLINIEFAGSAVAPGSYRIVKEARLPNDVAIQAYLGETFAPADSSSELQVNYSGGRMTFSARGIYMTTIGYWVNTSSYLSLNLSTQ